LPLSAVGSLIGWRGTFVLLGLFAVGVAIALFAMVPRRGGGERLDPREIVSGFKGVVTDWRLLRLAPLPATVVGTAFAIQGLWAARWLTDIDLYEPREVVRELFAMGTGLTVGAPLIGSITVWLRDRGCGETRTFLGFCLVFMALQLMLQTRLAVLSVMLWGMIGVFSAMPVASYSILGEMFAPGVIGRANSLLNVLHLTAAWVLQASMGLIVAAWPTDSSGHYPLIAYRSAFALPLVLQIAALLWFLLPLRSTDRGELSANESGEVSLNAD